LIIREANCSTANNLIACLPTYSPTTIIPHGQHAILCIGPESLPIERLVISRPLDACWGWLTGFPYLYEICLYLSAPHELLMVAVITEKDAASIGAEEAGTCVFSVIKTTHAV
jgi:hypothetical protein